MRIGVTDTMGDPAKFERYLAWLHSGTIPVECRVLSYLHDDVGAVEQCDGIVLTGGGDVDPAIFGGRINHPKLKGVDRKRDDFERGILDRALQAEMPVLGICRGLQLTNVHLGGTLIADLEEAGYTGHRGAGGREAGHPLEVEGDSFLRESVRVSRGPVNSSHHQAADKPGAGLRVAARAADGIVEAMELKDSKRRPFLLLVQWHPERSKDPEDPFSSLLLKSFLRAVRTNDNIHPNTRREQNVE
jgi:putative glutamine amidotransferase